MVLWSDPTGLLEFGGLSDGQNALETIGYHWAALDSTKVLSRVVFFRIVCRQVFM